MFVIGSTDRTRPGPMRTILLEPDGGRDERELPERGGRGDGVANAATSLSSGSLGVPATADGRPSTDPRRLCCLSRPSLDAGKVVTVAGTDGTLSELCSHGSSDAND
jgi:hypothetical protein